MERIVHLDLKGAPPKVQYLEKVLIAFRTWGATGILLEWEDTFPYTEELSDIGSQKSGDGLYSLSAVKHILQSAKEIGLEPIQLIQTIGHMEFVLKHPEFTHLREHPRSPAVLCPSNTESQVLVRIMLEQVLAVQPDAAYIHIGADEVWHTAVCTECQKKAASSEYKTASLFLGHIRNLALFIREKRPDLNVLIWDDMLRPMSLDTLKAYQLGDLVQPVLWHYNHKESFQMDANILSNLKMSFNCIWAGSAYKGANGSCQMLTPVARYVSNHEAWIDTFKANPDVNFVGVILTGWSRYDHYATFCELLPVSLPSLASCLRLLTNAEGLTNEAVSSEVLPSEQWPGEEFARYVHSFIILKERCLSFVNGELVTTWLNPWQIEHNYTQPIQVDAVVWNARHLLKELTAVENGLTTHLNDITGPRSSQEWLATFVHPVVKKLVDVCQIAEARCQAESGVRPVKDF